MRRLDAVIFDLDGTLIDSMGVWTQVDREFLERHGHTPPDDLFSDLEGGNSFEEVALYMQRKFDLPITIEQIMAEWTEMVADHYQHSVPLKPGVRAFLDRMQAAGIPMGVGTSNNLTLATAALKANGVFDMFGCVVVGGGELRGKPHPDIFEEAARRLSADSHHCLVVEDVLAGVQAAVAAGARVLGVRDIHASNEWDAIAQTANALFDDFHGVGDWVRQRYGV